LTKDLEYPIIHPYTPIIMDYKPYSMEWSRRRYLADMNSIYEWFEFEDEYKND